MREAVRSIRPRCRRNVRHEHRCLPHWSQEEAATDSKSNNIILTVCPAIYLLYYKRQPVHVYIKMQLGPSHFRNLNIFSL